MRNVAKAAGVVLCCVFALGGCGTAKSGSWNDPDSKIEESVGSESANRFAADIEKTHELKSAWLTMEIPNTWEEQDNDSGVRTFIPSVGGLATFTDRAGIDFTGENGRPEVEALLQELEKDSVTQVSGDVQERLYGGSAVTYTVHISQSQDGLLYKGKAYFLLSGHALYTLIVYVPESDYDDGYDKVIDHIINSMTLDPDAIHPPFGEGESSDKSDSSTEDSDNYPSEIKDPASYEQIPWSDLARTPDAYKGKSISVSGKVLQVVEGGDSYNLRVATDGDYSDVVLVVYSPSIMGGTRILEDDNVTILGTSMGTITYETTMGANKTIPGVLADSIRIG